MPKKELERLQAVNRFLKLEISKETELQQIVEQAAMICGSPIAMITFIDDQKQYIRFKVGTDLSEVNYDNTFCQHTIVQDDLLHISDTTIDPRFSANPFVTNGPQIRFYAGAPLAAADGLNVGTICVYDTNQKKLSDIQQRMLQGLSRQVVHLLEFDASLQLMKEQFIASRETANKLRSFFESSSSCHLLLDPDMRILAFNRALWEITLKFQGVYLKEGHPVIDYLHPQFREQYIASFNEALSGKTVKAERELEYRHGRICWYMTFEPAYDQEGRINGVSFNAIDLTDRVEQEKELREKNAALHKIRNIQLHELHQPVAEIVRLMHRVSADLLSDQTEERALLGIAVEELEQKINIS